MMSENEPAKNESSKDLEVEANDNGQKKKEEELKEENVDSSVKKKEKKPRKWINDRCDVKSKYGDTHPPARPCSVPICVKWFPDFLEQNCCCECLGRLGLVSADNIKARRWLMYMGLSSQIIGIALTIVACFAISKNYDILQATSFSHGEVDGRIIGDANGNFNESIPIKTVNLYIGLRAVGFNNPNPEVPIQTVASFDELCDLGDDVLGRYLENPGDCSDCGDVSSSLVATLFLSLISYIPSITTNIVRMYPNYDVNCQKSFGFFTGLFSLAMSLNTLLRYSNTCFASFFDGEIFYNTSDAADSQASVASMYIQEGYNAYADFDWNPGPGFICLLVATIVKLLDIIAHLVLPTPTITRDHTEQEEYEKL